MKSSTWNRLACAEKLKKEKQVVKLLLLEKSGMTATELYINYHKDSG